MTSSPSDGAGNADDRCSSNSDDSRSVESRRIGRATRRAVLRSAAAVPLVGLARSGSASSRADTGDRQGFGPELIEEDEEAGFNFPYYLYAPEDGSDGSILVECVNSGSPSDEMQHHVDAAERTIRGGLSRTISDELGVPFLVPVIKDPESGTAGDLRTQSLDTETMNIEDGRYARIDRQVVRMVDDARDRLSDEGYTLPEEFMLNGFSQSGNFGNNLALLQPDRVASVTAGGLNGLGILPVDETEGAEVDYQIGTADFEEITGEAFDEEVWREISQLGYIGANERPPTDDTIPYSGVWGDREQARRAVDVYGLDMQRERMVYTDAIHRRAGANTRFEVYDGVGHDNSASKIARDVLNFHASSLEVPYITVVRGQVGGADELELEVFVPQGDTDTLEVRAFLNGTDASEAPVEIRRGAPSRVTVPLSSTLAIDDTVEVAVFEPEESDLDDAIHAEERPVLASAEIRSTPEPGDTTLEVAYEVADTGLDLRVLTDGGALWWQRSTQLSTVGPNESGTETVEFTRRDEGVPFESGDEIELRASLPEEPETQQPVLDTVTVGDPDAYDPDTKGIRDVAHDDVEVAFRSPPTVDSAAVDVECSVSDSFDREVGLRLFPNTGTGRWGIDADWDFDEGWKSLPSVAPGETATGEHDVPAITFAETDVPALGSSVELRAYPDDWGELSDFVASAATVISGIRFTAPPEGGREDVSVEYLYPDRYDAEGEVHLSVDGETVAAISAIEPGTMDERTITIGEGRDSAALDAIPSGAEVTVSVGPTDGETLDTATRTAVPEDPAVLRFRRPPGSAERRISLEYRLSSEFETDRFATLRLYTENASEWGVLLGEVDPGEEADEEIAINPAEVDVPFQAGTEVEVKLVDWNDPYGNLPLAEVSAVVESGGTDSQTETEDSDSDSDDDGDDGDTESNDDTGDDSDNGDDGDNEADSNDGDDEANESVDADDESNESGDGDEDAAVDESVPGFGIVSAVAGVSGAAYLADRLRRDDSDDRRE